VNRARDMQAEADGPRDASPGGTQQRGGKEAPIRALGVSLLAVAAIATSLLLARRQEDDFMATDMRGGDSPAQQPLDAIRAAGL